MSQGKGIDKVMKAIGLDIGTTTICGVVLDGETGEVLFSRTLPNDTAISQGASFEKKQDPEKIWNKIQELLEEMGRKHPQVDSIGLTGQMHGILYVDGEGRAVSPLYTWQDESGNQRVEVEEGEDGQMARGAEKEKQGTATKASDSRQTYAEALARDTGYFAATGFGLTTYYYHQRKGLVPDQAAGLCTIGDYMGERLVGSQVPSISPSNGASLGIFDVKRGCFDIEKIKAAGLNCQLLPQVLSGAALLGRVCEAASPKIEGRAIYAGVPVSVALGDNQASFLGTVRNMEDTVLVNVGTGSQISVGTRRFVADSPVELRPLIQGDYIFAGSCLCGGRAYAALEQFFRQVFRMAEGKESGKLYGQMAALLEETKQEAASCVQVNPQFCGTRENPQLKGTVTGITLENLTPQSFIRGFLQGIARELYDLYEEILPRLEKSPLKLVGSGNGIRMNPTLKEAFEELFGCALQIPVHTEEAAYGTALFSLVAAGKYQSLTEAQRVIRYQ